MSTQAVRASIAAARVSAAMTKHLAFSLVRMIRVVKEGRVRGNNNHFATNNVGYFSLTGYFSHLHGELEGLYYLSRGDSDDYPFDALVGCDCEINFVVWYGSKESGADHYGLLLRSDHGDYFLHAKVINARVLEQCSTCRKLAGDGPEVLELESFRAVCAIVLEPAYIGSRDCYIRRTTTTRRTVTQHLLEHFYFLSRPGAIRNEPVKFKSCVEMAERWFHFFLDRRYSNIQVDEHWWSGKQYYDVRECSYNKTEEEGTKTTGSFPAPQKRQRKLIIEGYESSDGPLQGLYSPLNVTGFQDDLYSCYRLFWAPGKSQDGLQETDSKRKVYGVLFVSSTHRWVLRATMLESNATYTRLVGNGPDTIHSEQPGCGLVLEPLSERLARHGRVFGQVSKNRTISLAFLKHLVAHLVATQNDQTNCQIIENKIVHGIAAALCGSGYDAEVKEYWWTDKLTKYKRPCDY